MYMIPSALKRTLVAAIAAIVLGLPIRAQTEYDFILVDDFIGTYGLGECYIYDINDQNVACGTATIRIPWGGGWMTTYTGFHWSPAAEKTPVQLSWPRGISNPGVMAGTAQLYDIPSGVFTNMPLLPATYLPLVMLGVNDVGTAVGYVQICNCSNSQGTLQIPYLWDASGGARTVSVPGAKGLSRINNAGVAIGWMTSSSTADGFLIDIETGAYAMMNSVFPSSIGMAPTRAFDINDAGAVVGTRYGNYPVYFYGYVYSPGGGVQVLPFPGGVYQQAVKPLGINNSGTIVGEIYINGSSRAFVYSAADGIRDLNDAAVVHGIPAGYTMMTAQKINDNGWIAGYGYGGVTGMYKSYVLRPRTSAGDMNCDGTVNPFDITPFLTALSDPAAYGQAYPNCDINSADVDQNGTVNPFDIQPFIALLGG